VYLALAVYLALLKGGVIQHGTSWFIDHSMDTSWSGRGSVCLS
jgi:hypothetical protein